MLILPHKQIMNIEAVNYFQNYNQYSYIEEFRNFPINSAEYMIKKISDFIIYDNVYTNNRLGENNITTDDLLFSKHVLSVKGEEDKTIMDFIVSGDIRTFNINFIEKIYYRFYVFDDYEFNPVNEVNVEHWVHNSNENDTGILYLSYSLGSKFMLNEDEDIRIINFFVDKTYHKDNLYSLLGKVADSLIIEYFRHTSKHQIPMNTLSNYNPAYIILPKFITVDAITFIYNYFCLLALIFSKTTIFMDEGRPVKATDYIRMQDEGKHIDLDFYKKFPYYKMTKEILSGCHNPDTILDDIYEAYCIEMGLKSS